MGRFFRYYAALGAALLLVPAANAHANNISFFSTVFNTDYVTSAVGLRDVGAGDISVSGVSGSVTKAYLFWHGPTNSADATANADVTFAGSAITGTNIGFSDDNFWAFENSQAYRADVTSLIAGDGAYALADFQKVASGVAINSASLWVFFDDGNAANNRDVVLFNGNDANFPNAFDANGWNITLAGINYSGGPTSLRTYVSDGQNFGANDDGTLVVNGNNIATGGIFQGLAPKAPGAGVSNGSLGDINDFDLTALMVAGPNVLNISMAEVNDALSLVVAGIDLPAGAAPPPPPVPEPASVLLLGSGLALALRRRLGRR